MRPLFTAFLLLLCVWTTAADSQLDLGESLDRRYDQNTYLSTHNAFANAHDHFEILTANQRYGIKRQLDDGVRCLALDIYIVRQKTVDDDLGIPTRYVWERYKSRDAYKSPSEDFEGTDPEIAVAHEPDKWDYLLYEAPFLLLYPFQNLIAPLTEIKEWMDEHPNEVVTITFESYVFDPDALWSYFQAAELDNMVFFADRPNPGIYGSDSKPWDVTVHGWPTLRHMVQANKRLVLFSGNGVEWNLYSGGPVNGPKTTDDDGLPLYWNFVVENNYGDDSIDEVDKKRSASYELNDLTFPLTAMNWFPDANVQGPDMGGGNDPDKFLWNFGSLNSYSEVGRARDKFFNANGKRYPNFISVDYYHKGGNGGPSHVVKDCNVYWANRQKVTATITVTPKPNIYDWHKSADVKVTSRAGDAFNRTTQINYYWHGGDDILGNSQVSSFTTAMPLSITLTNSRGTNVPGLGLTTDGIFRVSAEGVTGFGERSDRAVSWIRVDGTAPIVQPITQRPPDERGWFNKPVTIQVIVSDLLSGARAVWWTNALGLTHYSEKFNEVIDQYKKRTFEFDYSQEGSVFVQFKSQDFADNFSAANSGFIEMKMDRTAPFTVVSSITNVTVAGNAMRRITLEARDTLSGPYRTLFQTDNNTVWSIYGASIMLPATGSHTIRFYSIDVAGNFEPVQYFYLDQVGVGLTSDRNPSGYYQALELTATVKAIGNGAPPAGKVTFLDDGKPMGSATLDTNGIARFVATPISYRLSEGEHRLTARYDGNANYSPVTSQVLMQNVVWPPGVEFTTSHPRILQTESIDLSARVFSETLQVPSGSVLFRIRNGVSGREVMRFTSTLDTNGVATASTDLLPVGYYTLSAEYLGDEAHPPSEGAVKELFVDQAFVTLAITTTPNPSHWGEAVTFHITPTLPTQKNIAGSVRIEEQDAAIENIPLNGTNTVAYTTAALDEGAHNFLLFLNTSAQVHGSAIHQHTVLPQQAPPPQFREISAGTGGGVTLSLDVMPGRPVQIEYTDQLANWVSLTTATNTEAFLSVIDFGATNSTARLYRARLLE